MNFLNKTRGLPAWHRVLRITVRRPSSAPVRPQAHVPSFGLLVTRIRER